MYTVEARVSGNNWVSAQFPTMSEATAFASFFMFTRIITSDVE